MEDYVGCTLKVTWAKEHIKLIQPIRIKCLVCQFKFACEAIVYETLLAIKTICYKPMSEENHDGYHSVDKITTHVVD